MTLALGVKLAASVAVADLPFLAGAPANDTFAVRLSCVRFRGRGDGRVARGNGTSLPPSLVL